MKTTVNVVETITYNSKSDLKIERTLALILVFSTNYCRLRIVNGTSVGINNLNVQSSNNILTLTGVRLLWRATQLNIKKRKTRNVRPMEDNLLTVRFIDKNEDEKLHWFLYISHNEEDWNYYVTDEVNFSYSELSKESLF